MVNAIKISFMFRKQPKIEVKPTKTDRLVMRVGWALVALHFILVVVFYADLPDTIATHFNLKGVADGFGHKKDLWALPILTLFFYYGLWLLTTRMKPWNYNYPTKVTEVNAPALYALSIQMMVWLNIGILLTFLAISVHSILLAKEIHIHFMGWLPMVLVAGITLYPFLVIYQMFQIPKT